MTQQADWIKEREAIRERAAEIQRSAALGDEGSGDLAKEDRIWLLAELRRLLAKSEEDERAMKQSAKEAGEFAEKCYVEESRLQTELALREQRISELETAVHATLDENGHLADGEICTLINLKRVDRRPSKQRG